jgi:hypothetical protein
MKNINKISNISIALVFILGYNIVFSPLAYANKKTCLRIPITSSNLLDSQQHKAVIRRLLCILDEMTKTRSSFYPEFLREIKGAPMPLINDALSSSTLLELFNVKDLDYYRGLRKNRLLFSIVHCFDRNGHESTSDEYESSLFKKRMENHLRNKKQIERSLSAIESLSGLSDKELNGLHEHIRAYYKYMAAYINDWKYWQRKDKDSEKSRLILRNGLVFLGEAMIHLEEVSEILKSRGFYDLDKILSDKRLSGIREHFRKFPNDEKDLPVQDRKGRDAETVSEFWAGISSLEKGKENVPDRVVEFEKLKEGLSEEIIYYITHSLPNSLRSQLDEVEFYLGGVDLIRRFNFSICKGSEKSGIMDLKGAWNPLIGPYEKTDKIDIGLGISSNFLGITGPNEAGKTTILRTAGLCALFYHMGLPIPAEAESVVGIFKNIYTVIPESIETDNPEEIKLKSRQKLLALKDKVGQRDLLLVDEVTIYSDHASLAKEMADLMEEFISRGATVIYTTHLKDTMRLLDKEVPGIKLQQLVYEGQGGDKKIRLLKPGIARASDLTQTLKNVGYPESIVRWTEEYYESLTQGNGDIQSSGFSEQERYYAGDRGDIFGFKDVESVYLGLKNLLFWQDMFHFSLS